MNEQTLRELLTELATRAPSTTAADSYRAAETGRARHHRRQLWAVAAAALVVLVTVAGVVFVLGPSHRPAPVTGPVTPDKPLPKLTAATTVAPTSFDPLRTRVESSWLPAGLSYWEVHIEAGSVMLSAGTTTDVDNIQVFLGKRGGGGQESYILPGPPPVGSKITFKSQPGPWIRGQRSTWYPNGDGEQTRWPGRYGRLDFTWAQGATAQVTVKDLPNKRDVALRIAKTIRVELGVPTGLPFKMAQPKVKLLRIDISHRVGGASGFRLFYWERRGVGPGYQIDVDTIPDGGIFLSKDIKLGPYWVDLGANTGGGYDDYHFRPVDGVYAAVEGRPEGSTKANEGPAKTLAQKVVASFRMTGRLTDPSTWNS